jgi:predicted RNase H-like HicB family nuclease
MKYIYVLRKVDQNYVAFVPDLPGCVASGKTALEAREAIKTTVDMHLKGLAADGLRIPQPSVQKDYQECLDPILPLTPTKPEKPTKPAKTVSAKLHKLFGKVRAKSN